MRPSALSIERWRQVDLILDDVLDLSGPDRAAFLADACGGDYELRTEVDKLLRVLASADEEFGYAADSLRSEVLEYVASEQVRGRRIGPFRLADELGRGGMGVVYLAEDTRLGRKVALKALPAFRGVDDESRQRFLSEAKAVSSLDHPNIATLYEINVTDDGQYYMVFAFYEGETLDQRISRGPIPFPEALSIATDLASGLAAAHERGIIHRDVKPSNVLIGVDGDVKLLDFGVAKVAGERITRDGARLGTIAYMSPEQADGESVDPRTDLWSLGVVLFEMLTARRPFGGTNRASLLHAILNKEVPPVSAPGIDIPEEVRTVVAKLISRRRDDRYGSADDVLLDLNAVRAGRSLSIASTSAQSRPLRFAKGMRAVTSRWQLFLVAMAAVLIVAAVAWAASTGTHGQIQTLAVLPLQSGSEGGGGLYLANGLQDALIAELGKIGSLGVISKNSSQRYRDTEKSVAQIGEELNVDAVLGGSVLRDGDSLSVTTTLIEASTGRQVWAGSYRREIGGVLQLSSEVARSIAAEIGLSLTPAERTRLRMTGTVNPAAYDAFALGQFNLERRSQEGFELAQAYLRRAIEIDSGFAPAYTTLAEAYGSAAFFGLVDPAEAMPRVRELAEAALALDSTVAEAHMLLGAVKLYWDWDWSAADREVRRAIAINPSLSRAYGILSEVQSIRGRYADALETVEKGAEMDRLVPFSAFRPVAVLYYMRDFDEAIEQARAGLAFFARFWQGHWLLCLSLAGDGRPDEAIASCEKAVEFSRRTPMALAGLGYAYAQAGRTEDAIRVVNEVEQMASERYVGATSVAMVYTGLGNHDRAFEWLDRAYRQHDVALVHLRNHAVFDSLRPDPRFAVLVEDMKIPVPSSAEAG